MASPAASTPSSAASPAAISIAPAPCNAAARLSASGPSSRMTSIAPSAPSPVNIASIGPTKQWVLPPRPKPGRKPATDTPPTKRKAQNRAAQRAFRERRAARVGELEEQLKETEEQRLQREQEMREQIEDQHKIIDDLEQKVKKFSEDTQAWVQRYNELQRTLAWEKQEKDAALVELSYLRNGARSTGTDAVPLPPRRHRPQLPPLVSIPFGVPADEPIGCGGCSSGSKCACMDAVMEISTAGCGRCSPDRCECLEETLRSAPIEHKRPLSPSTGVSSNKRVRQSVEVVGPLEMDFTLQYSRPALATAPMPVPVPHRPTQDIASILNTPLRSTVDSCGFCSKDTFCLCEAAAAAEAEAAANGNMMNEIRIAPLLSEVTPPPSDTDVTISDQYKLPVFQPSERTLSQQSTPRQGGCSGVPGSCAQCQDDPKSGLFCRSLAAMRDSGSSVDGCCGGSSASGGCCKSQPPPPPPTTRTPVPAPREPALSCAEAYKTLKSHRGFEQATNELGTWLPKLEMVERAGEGKYPGRPAYEVRAASVMSVLKDFDVRFGKETGRR